MGEDPSCIAKAQIKTLNSGNLLSTGFDCHFGYLECLCLLMLVHSSLGFWGSEVVYTFNSYVLFDHPPQELANDPNPFSAVMEAAWQYINKPKDEQALAQLKLDMIKRLLRRNLPKNQVKGI
jgi:hypothetical protein